MFLLKLLRLKVLLINSDDGPDYLADLVNYFFITSDLEVSTNHIIDFLFDDYQNLDNLYGKGFTLYGKLSHKLKNNITELQLEEIFDTFDYFDIIIFTSIHRKYKLKDIKDSLFFKLIKKINSSNVIVLDGEDFTEVDTDISQVSKYYKRELINQYKEHAHPISFTFPALEASKNLTNFSKKSQILAPMDPRFLNSYIYEDEASYFNQYKKSHFGVTTKKAGWDCMRHYEILSCNTLLFFPDILSKPETTMSDFPTNLQVKVNDLFKKLILSSDNFDSLEKIRLQYPSKNYFTRGIKKVRRKLSKLNVTQNNLNELSKFSTEFENWFANYGTTASYKKVFKI